MTVAELLAALRQRGVQLAADGELLKVSAPPGAVTPELAADIRAHKQAILRFVAAATEARRDAGPRRVAPAPDQDRYPLSAAQRRAAAVRATTAMLPSAFRLVGPLDRAALQQALERFTARHAPLRSRFELDADPPAQVVRAAVEVELPLTDLGDLPPGASEPELRRLLAEQARTPLQLDHGPPFRYHLYRLSPTQHALYAGFSPLVFDGWCFDLFWHELRRGYAAIRAGEPPLPPLPNSYADHVADLELRLRQRAPELAAFWRRTLGTRLPPLPLPTDFPRPPLAAGRGESLPFELPPATVQQVGASARAHEVTPQMVMLGALFVWLARLSTRTENVVATPVEARLAPGAELVVGPFANIVLLRFAVDFDAPFAQLLPQLRDLCLAAYQHQDYPLEQVDVEAERLPGERFAPAFQVEFSYQLVHGRGAEMGDLTLSQIELESGAAGNDLVLWVKDWGPRIGGAVEFRPELFQKATVAHWIGCYQQLLAALCAAPDRPVGRVDLLGPELAVVQRARAAHPEAPAVVDPRGQVLPLGIPGRVLGRAGDGLLRLLADGRLEPWPPVAALPPAAELPDEPPVNAIEARIADLFAELTGATAVGVRHGFFALGGTSLKAVRLFQRLQELFGARLPLTTILAADTPRALAQVVSGDQRARRGSLVELRAGRSTSCLFLIHDADGESLLYRELARHLPEALGVYGLEPLRRGPLPVVHTSIAEFAAHYAAEIRRQQPVGPYHVGGLCAGGLIAFEVARQLRAAGETVALIVLHECGTPDTPKRAASERVARLRSLLGGDGGAGLLARLGALAAKAAGFIRWRLAARRRRAAAAHRLALLQELGDTSRPWPDGEPPPTMREVWQIVEADYRPEPLPDQAAVLYRATRGEGADLAFRDYLADPLFGWGPVLPRLAVVDLPGGHYTSLRAPHVAALAADLALRLAAAPAAPAPPIAGPAPGAER